MPIKSRRRAARHSDDDSEESSEFESVGYRNPSDSVASRLRPRSHRQRSNNYVYHAATGSEDEEELGEEAVTAADEYGEAEAIILLPSIEKFLGQRPALLPPPSTPETPSGESPEQSPVGDVSGAPPGDSKKSAFVLSGPRLDYLVKFAGCSYTHAQWLSHEKVQELIQVERGVRTRYNHFLRRCNGKNELPEAAYALQPQVERIVGTTDLFRALYPSKAAELGKSEWYMYCMRIVDSLACFTRHGIHYGVPFLNAVDEEKDGAPGYYEIVKEPMDFTTIQTKLYLRLYRQPQEFWSDVKRIFTNARAYNATNTDIVIQAALVEKLFDKLYAEWARLSRRVANAQKEQRAHNVPEDQITIKKIEDLSALPEDIPAEEATDMEIDCPERAIQHITFKSVVDSPERQLMYLVKWKRLSYTEVTWEHMDILSADTLKIAQFHRHTKCPEQLIEEFGVRGPGYWEANLQKKMLQETYTYVKSAIELQKCGGVQAMGAATVQRLLVHLPKLTDPHTLMSGIGSRLMKSGVRPSNVSHAAPPRYLERTANNTAKPPETPLPYPPMMAFSPYGPPMPTGIRPTPQQIAAFAAYQQQAAAQFQQQAAVNMARQGAQAPPPAGIPPAPPYSATAQDYSQMNPAAALQQQQTAHLQAALAAQQNAAAAVAAGSGSYAAAAFRHLQQQQQALFAHQQAAQQNRQQAVALAPGPPQKPYQQQHNNQQPSPHLPSSHFEGPLAVHRDAAPSVTSVRTEPWQPRLALISTSDPGVPVEEVDFTGMRLSQPTDRPSGPRDLFEGGDEATAAPAGSATTAAENGTAPAGSATTAAENGTQSQDNHEPPLGVGGSAKVTQQSPNQGDQVKSEETEKSEDTKRPRYPMPSGMEMDLMRPDEPFTGPADACTRSPIAEQYAMYKRPPPSTNNASRLYPASPVFKGNLKLFDYQLEGVNWLLHLWEMGRSGILADEMGLGKTVQTMVFFWHLFYKERYKGPFLVVAPLSTIDHWKKTADDWTDMNTVLYYDEDGRQGRDTIRRYEWFHHCLIDNVKDGRVGLPARGAASYTDPRIVETTHYKFHVLVTSYETFQADAEILAPMPWQFVVVDEAHKLKNRLSKMLQTLRQIACRHLLLLTGTFVQNNTEEMWPLLNFIEPVKFSDVEAFKTQFGELTNPEQVEDLNKLLRPYLLRRVKEDVAHSIPPLEETIIDVELTNLQKAYYRAIFERNITFLNKMITTKDNKTVAPKLMNVEMELRKCCNHPFMIAGVEEREFATCKTQEERFRKLTETSGKMVLLNKLLPKLKDEGHKVLIFSQFTHTLTLIEEFLTYRGWKLERIDGSIKGQDRTQAINRFNDPDSDRFVFLLSTRAGGLGINLTSADHVVIFDSDWNPQNDVQATARAHRIGQDKEVKVYRLITARTYEAEMFDRASKKLGLNTAVFYRGAFGSENRAARSEDSGTQISETQAPSKKEIEELLRNGAYYLLDKDNTDASEAFQESNIEDILSKNTRLVRYQLTGQSSTFAKTSFRSEQACDLNMDDPDFWQKVMTESSSRQLLTRLNDGSAVASATARANYLRDLSNAVESIAAEEDPEPIIEAIVQVTHQRDFSYEDRQKAEEWLQQVQAVLDTLGVKRQLLSASPSASRGSDTEEESAEEGQSKGPRRSARTKYKDQQQDSFVSFIASAVSAPVAGGDTDEGASKPRRRARRDDDQEEQRPSKRPRSGAGLDDSEGTEESATVQRIIRLKTSDLPLKSSQDEDFLFTESDISDADDKPKKRGGKQKKRPTTDAAKATRRKAPTGDRPRRQRSAKLKQAAALADVTGGSVETPAEGPVAAESSMKQSIMAGESSGFSELGGSESLLPVLPQTQSLLSQGLEEQKPSSTESLIYSSPASSGLLEEQILSEDLASENDFGS